MLWKNKKVGVLLGGLSREREVSLKSGQAVSEALKRKGYEVVVIDMGRDVASKISSEKIDVAFIALHGRYGEDGAIQGLLEILQIPYTGSGILGSSVGMSKELTKVIAVAESIQTPKGILFSKGDKINLENLNLPMIVKPNREGSTIGMTRVQNISDLGQAMDEAFKCDQDVLVEEWVTGREYTVAVLEGKALPLIEVVPKGGFYDFNSKYTKGMTEYRVPAEASEKAAAQMRSAAEKMHRRLGLSGVSRSDFIVNAQDEAYFLEINTIPGMTETSLVPKAAACAGIAFDDLCEMILNGASLKEGGQK